MDLAQIEKMVSAECSCRIYSWNFVCLALVSCLFEMKFEDGSSVVKLSVTLFL